MINWPDFIFPPINLLSFPKQNIDFMQTRNIRLDNRAKSLQLNPRPRQTSSFNTHSITPPRSEASRMEFERMTQIQKILRNK